MMTLSFGGRRAAMYLNSAILGLAILAMPCAARAQVAMYVEGTASDMQQGPGGDYLYGGTLGLLYEGPHVFKGVYLSADVQARYVTRNGERLVGAAVGPRISLAIRKLRLDPYGEFLVGFARYRDSAAAAALNTTDNQFEVNMGAVRRLTARFDVMADYCYSQYGTENGKYSPKNFSGGMIFHFVRK